MARRRTTWGVCALALLAAATWVAWTTVRARARPLHVWIRDDDPGTVLHASPDGPAVEGWQVVVGNARMVSVSARPAAWAVWLAERGLDLRPRETWSLAASQAAPVAPGWTEFFADGGPWPPGADPDPDLAGDWVEGFPAHPEIIHRTLEPDGTVHTTGDDGPGRGLRWGRAGEMLVFGRPPSDDGPGRISWIGVLAPDGRSYRGVLGEVGRRASDDGGL